MKRGSSVLQPPSDATKRHTHPANTHVKSHTSDDALSLSVQADTHAENILDTHTAGSSPFPAATSLFSPDVSTKMASDLLIRLSEATQKAQMHPGSRAEAETQRREALPEGHGGQQDEPGPALSPDGPGASPEPPSLTHTPDGNAATDTLASDLLRKLAESQEVISHGVRVKEEEESMEADTLAQNMASNHLFTIKTESPGIGGVTKAAQLHPGTNMADQCPVGPKVEDTFYNGSRQSGSMTADSSNFQFRVKVEDHGVAPPGTPEHVSPGANMEEQFLFKAKAAERPFSTSKFLSGVNMEDQVFSGAKTEDPFTCGAKMADQCLRAVLWQDMSVNLASTLLHQLSERVNKSNSQLAERTTPIRSSPVLKVNGNLNCSPPPRVPREPPYGTQTSRSSPAGRSYFYRCHVCGFETEGRALFHNHMTEHHQREHGSFSLHCCLCDHSTNQEAAMRAHADTHIHGDTGANGEMRCPITPPAAAAAASSTPTVAKATLLETSTSEHRCRICQRSFPGQQELLVHFQGHRQGNQYRCDRCGHLTRTANKLVEHVRVHTGERPFTCDLCPYSAKRRDSLRLHCKVKHPAHVNGNMADAPGDVHTHRSYVHGDNQRSNKHVQRLHTNTHNVAHSSSSSLPPLHPSLSDRAGWRDLSPLVPITTLISLKPRSPSSSSSSYSSSSTKNSFLCYLGLTTSL